MILIGGTNITHSVCLCVNSLSEELLEELSSEDGVVHGRTIKWQWLHLYVPWTSVHSMGKV